MLDTGCAVCRTHVLVFAYLFLQIFMLKAEGSFFISYLIFIFIWFFSSDYVSVFNMYIKVFWFQFSCCCIIFLSVAYIFDIIICFLYLRYYLILPEEGWIYTYTYISSLCPLMNLNLILFITYTRVQDPYRNKSSYQTKIEVRCIIIQWRMNVFLSHIISAS